VAFVRYEIAEVCGTWRLQARWWEREGESGRTYYRLRTADHQIFEVYFDDVPGVWVLSAIQD
jgi:hypothetical protein